MKRILSQGKDALLIIDIQGAIKVKEIIPSAILIFLLPPSLEELKRRLINRAEKEWELRFKWAVEKELPCVKVSDYVVINDNLNKARRRVFKKNYEQIKYYKYSKFFTRTLDAFYI